MQAHMSCLRKMNGDRGKGGSNGGKETRGILPLSTVKWEANNLASNSALSESAITVLPLESIRPSVPRGLLVLCLT